MSDSISEHILHQPKRQKLSPDALRLHAPAKINLNLLVGPRREDEYHSVDSCIAKISLYDSLQFRRRHDGEITLHCHGLSCGAVEDNLVMRAARMLADLQPVPGVDISLVKNIPSGGGLGGGSSDAACTLAGLNELWGLNLPDRKSVV